MRTIAIGDVHGCLKALSAIIQAIELLEEDHLIFLGDLVDRGEDSKGVVDFVQKLGQRCRVDCVQGNHEIVMLATCFHRLEPHYWKLMGGEATLQSYGGAIDLIPNEHLQFLGAMSRWIETEDHIFVHAGYDAELEMDLQTDLELYWQHLSDPIPKPHCSGKRVLCGHTPQLSGEIADWGHLRCIDTFCFGGGWLTALDVHSNRAWQADRYGKLRRSD